MVVDFVGIPGFLGKQKISIRTSSIVIQEEIMGFKNTCLPSDLR
jgi:hypothetical protein